jgi:hypothetical protein
MISGESDWWGRMIYILTKKRFEIYVEIFMESMVASEQVDA